MPYYIQSQMTVLKTYCWIAKVVDFCFECWYFYLIQFPIPISQGGRSYDTWRYSSHLNNKQRHHSGRLVYQLRSHLAYTCLSLAVVCLRTKIILEVIATILLPSLNSSTVPVFFHYLKQRW